MNGYPVLKNYTATREQQPYYNRLMHSRARAAATLQSIVAQPRDDGEGNDGDKYDEGPNHDDSDFHKQSDATPLHALSCACARNQTHS